MESSDDDLLDQFWEEEDDSDDDNMVIATLAALAEEEQLQESQPRYRGAILGRDKTQRDLFGGNLRIVAHYFADHPVYNEKFFRRRYRMSKSLFLRVVDALESHDDYFRQRPNAAGLLGATPLQKIFGSLRMLAYGVPADLLDDVVQLSESTLIESYQYFVKGVYEVFGERYLRAPNAEDTARLLAINNARGFPGMLGCIDCMHWRWKMCPTAWKGAYSGRHDGPTMILEAVASKDLWIWHAFFGLLGSLNDINVLHRSPLFQRLTSGASPPIEYMVNGNKYTMGYYLADGIYLSWATFVKSFSNPQGNKKVHFAKVQEAVRKDVERAFGVLQARFAMVRGPARWWKETLWYTMMAAVILHNMRMSEMKKMILIMSKTVMSHFKRRTTNIVIHFYWRSS